MASLTPETLAEALTPEVVAEILRQAEESKRAMGEFRALPREVLMRGADPWWVKQ